MTSHDPDPNTDLADDVDGESVGDPVDAEALTSRIAGASSDGPAQELIDAGFAWEIADAPLLHAGLNLADLGHVIDLHQRGVIPDRAAADLLSELLVAHATPAEEFPYDAQFGEPYNSRERLFAERLGNTAGWLHAGRPRREAARVAFRILLREQAACLVVEAGRFASDTATVASAHNEVLMPDQTYLQQAQPSTFGHYLLAFVPPALRDGERLVSALDEVNQSPGGAGCVNGSRLLEDRATIAELLGFGDVIEHTRDAMWQTDTFIDLLATSTSLISNQSKLAEDLEIWASQEFDYVDLAGPYTRSSVLMPQKRNPYALTIVRGASGVLIGRLSGFLAVVKSPSARSDNLIFAYGEIPRALELSTRISALMSGVVRTLTVNSDRMWEELQGGFSQATDLAEFIMSSTGIDYRSAYRIVGQAVRAASSAKLRGLDITSAMIDEAAREICDIELSIDPDQLAAVLDPRSIVDTRTAIGGAAPEVVHAMAERFQRRADGVRAEGERHLDHFAATEKALVARARSLVSAYGGD
ncbi:MAG: argininosuccinate lyase [Ilumatobacter sp.]|uniref:argininosuccinate lyase n=1 Tax=Ilumatobacter sp. TaxID=1967498 RepID=UPI00391B54C9